MKIDVNKIDGYSEMTPEQKISALESFEMDDGSAEMQKLKNALNKASSDVATYKKQWQEKLSEEERLANERKEAQELMEKELKTLKYEKTVSSNKASLLGIGYDAELAQSTAEAMADGDFAKILENQKLFAESLKRATRESSLGQQPPLSNGSAVSSKQIEEAENAKLMKWAGL